MALLVKISIGVLDWGVRVFNLEQRRGVTPRLKLLYTRRIQRARLRNDHRERMRTLE